MSRSSFRTILIALLAAIALFATVQQATAQPAAKTKTILDANKGPVGWDTYRQLNRISELTSGNQTKQFSSFDRDGGNDDYWESPDQCQRVLDGQCVLAEHTGPGEVDAIWFTTNGGDVTSVGNITITLDGKQIMHAPLQDVVDGKLGAPFSYPLVANADQSSGGVNISVPMPFASSMRITTDSASFYYHVTYRTFADASGVRTFDPSDPASDVLAALNAAGTRDPKPAVPGARATSAAVDLAPGQSGRLSQAKGPGEMTQIRLQLPQAQYVKPNIVTDDGRAFGKDGSSTFTVAVDPTNSGVRLTRRLDPPVANQVATVSVDGATVGKWAPSSLQGSGVWGEESIDLPASVTTGKSKIAVTNTFVSSDLDFNEFTYWVDSLVGGKAKRTDTVDVGNAESESAHQYKIVGQTWQGVRTSAYPMDDSQLAELAKTKDILRGLRLRISFDGKQLVDSPVGEFFGSGDAVEKVSSLMFAMDPKPGGWYTAWWPMPYLAGANVLLYNDSTQKISGKAEVTSAPDPSAAVNLALGKTGYFRTTSNSGTTTSNEDWNYLTATGTGKYVGNTVDMRGPAERRYLEGDERVYTDGSQSPQIHGTGTEDYYQSGWYFNRDTYSNPLHGNPAHLTAITGCGTGYDCTSAYRLWLAEAVPFGSNLTFGIEHGDVNDVQADYASTAYWYGRAATTVHQSDALTIGDKASESAHNYQSNGSESTLAATFEGKDGPQNPVTAKTSASTGPVSFTMTVDPLNVGATLTRMSDQQHGYQSVRVSVNGTRLPDWTQPLDNPYHRWLDDTYSLPTSVTFGRTKLAITLTPNTGAPAWSAASYRIAPIHPTAGLP